MYMICPAQTGLLMISGTVAEHEGCLKHINGKMSQLVFCIQFLDKTCKKNTTKKLPKSALSPGLFVPTEDVHLLSICLKYST